MSRLQSLEDSRLAGVIGQIERGEDVDYRRVLALQALDIAREGELCVVDALRREDAEHEWCEQYLADGT